MLAKGGRGDDGDIVIRAMYSSSLDRMVNTLIRKDRLGYQKTLSFMNYYSARQSVHFDL